MKKLSKGVDSQPLIDGMFAIIGSELRNGGEEDD